MPIKISDDIMLFAGLDEKELRSPEQEGQESVSKDAPIQYNEEMLNERQSALEIYKGLKEEDVREPYGPWSRTGHVAAFQDLIKDGLDKGTIQSALADTVFLFQMAGTGQIPSGDIGRGGYLYDTARAAGTGALSMASGIAGGVAGAWRMVGGTALDAIHDYASKAQIAASSMANTKNPILGGVGALLSTGAGGVKAAAGLMAFKDTDSIEESLKWMDFVSSLPANVLLENDRQMEILEASGKPFEWMRAGADHFTENILTELESRGVVEDSEQAWVLGAIIASTLEGTAAILGPKAVGKGFKAAKGKYLNTYGQRLKRAKARLEKTRNERNHFRVLANKEKVMKLREELKRNPTDKTILEEIKRLDEGGAAAETAQLEQLTYMEKRIDLMLDLIGEDKWNGKPKSAIRKRIGETISPDEWDYLKNYSRERYKKVVHEVKQASTSTIEESRAVPVGVKPDLVRLAETLERRPPTVGELMAVENPLKLRPRPDIPPELTQPLWDAVHHEMGITNAWIEAEKQLARNRVHPIHELSTQAIADSMRPFSEWVNSAYKLIGERDYTPPGPAPKQIVGKDVVGVRPGTKKGFDSQAWEKTRRHVESLRQPEPVEPLTPKRMIKDVKPERRLSDQERKTLRQTYKFIKEKSDRLSDSTVQSVLDATVLKDSMEEGLMLSESKLRRGDVTLSFLGSQEAYEAAVHRINAMRTWSVQLGKSFVDVWDIERPFRKLGAPRTGFAVKNSPSTQAAYEQMGLARGHNFAMRMKKSKVDQYAKDIVFSVEDKSYFNSLPKQVRESIQPFVRELRKFFDDAQKTYAKWGIKADWKARILDQIEQLLKEDLTNESRAQLMDSIKAMEKYEYAHIPVHMFDTLMEKSGSSMNIINPFVLNVLKKRRGFTFKSVADQMGPDFINEIHPSDLIASYMRRMGKDAAVVNLLKSGVKDGLIKISKTERIPKAMRNKRGLSQTKELQLKLKEESADFKELGLNPDLYRQLRKDMFSFTPGRKYVHEVLYDAIEGMLKYGDETTGWWSKTASFIKMNQFYNPLFLPTYDAVQAGMHIVPDLWNPKNYLVLGKSVKKAFKSWKAKDNNFFRAQLEGLSSTPFKNPFKDWMQMVDNMKQTYPEMFAGMGKRALRTAGLSLIKDAYNLSHQMAWGGDQMMRMVSYEYLKAKGLNSHQAAQTAALYHGDYASVPAQTRSMLNKIFFTPTFKIAMTKLYGRMVKDFIKSSYKLGRVDKQTRVFAKGLVGAFAINQIMDTILTSVGYERDQWGRRYIAKDKYDPLTGDSRDLAIVFSNPANMMHKYVLRAWDALTKTEPGESKLFNFMKMNKYELTPAITIMWNVLATNEDFNGDAIANPFAPTHIRGAQQLQYIVKNIWKVSEIFSSPGMSEAGRRIFAKEYGGMADKLSGLFMFKYAKNPDRNRAKIYRLRKLRYMWRKHATDHARTGRSVPDRDRQYMYHLLNKIQEDWD